MNEKRPPRSPASRGPLPPEGALAALGRPGGGETRPPRSPASRGPLPPEGALAALGRPGGGEAPSASVVLEAERAQRGIQSIEVGGQLLQALVHHGRPMALKDLAREADMSAAKAHPYMVSFGRIGLVAQDGASGHYRLGPLAVQLGLIGLQQSDPVQAATPLLPPLAQALGHTVALAVWGERGATIVRIAEADTPLRVTLRHGTVFSLAHTASGRLFGAHLEPAVVRARLEADRRRVAHEAQDATGPAAGMPAAQPVPAWPAFEAEMAEVRTRGLSRSEGEIVPGISAMAAPVFEPAGAMVLALVAIGPAATFDSRWSGAVARDLLACAREISQRLGRV